MTNGPINFTMLFQIDDGLACIVFSLFSKRSIDTCIKQESQSFHHVDHLHEHVNSLFLSMM